MTTACIIAATVIFCLGLFAALVDRTNQRDDALDALAASEAECVELARVARVAATENTALDQANMRLHDALTEAQRLRIVRREHPIRPDYRRSCRTQGVGPMTTELSYPIVTPTGFPYGVRCMDCDRDLFIGDPYTDRAYSMCGNDMVTEIVCVYCANSDAQ